MSNPNPVRVSAGVPNGGQYATDLHPEADEQFDESMTAVPLAELDIPMGTSLQIDDFESGSNVFTGIEVTPSRDQPGFDAVGMVPLDLREGLCAGMSEQDSDDYLNAHSTQIEAYLDETYGAGLDGGDSWDDQSATFVAQLPVEARTDQLLESLETTTRAVDLHNDANGAYGGQLHGFYGVLREHLDAQDQQGRDTASIADRLGIAPGERIGSRHPDFSEIGGFIKVVEDEYGEVSDHWTTLLHHLPSGRLLAATTVSDPYAPGYLDGPPDPTGADLAEIAAGDDAAAARFPDHVRDEANRHLAQVPVVDDAAHLTPARIERRIATGLPRGVTVVPGSVGFPDGSFGRESAGARGPNPTEVHVVAHMTNGHGISYSANVAGGKVAVYRRNVFNAGVQATVELTDGTPTGVGRAINAAVADADRKEQQRAALVGGLRSRLPITTEPAFHESDGGGFAMVVSLPRRGAPGQSNKQRPFGVKVTADGEVTVAKNSLVDGTTSLETRTAQIPAGSNFTAAAESIISAIQQMKD